MESQSAATVVLQMSFDAQYPYFLFNEENVDMGYGAKGWRDRRTFSLVGYEC